MQKWEGLAVFWDEKGSDWMLLILLLYHLETIKQVHNNSGAVFHQITSCKIVCQSSACKS